MCVTCPVAERRLLERERHSDADIGAALRCIASRARRTTSAETAENGGEDVVHIEPEAAAASRSAETAEAAVARSALSAHRTVLVAVSVESGALVGV